MAFFFLDSLSIHNMMQRIANENAADLCKSVKDLIRPKQERLENNDARLILRKPVAFSFAVLCIIVFRLSSIFRAVDLFRSHMLLIFNMVWPRFFCGTVFFSVRSFLVVATTWYFGFFQLFFETSFASDIGQSAKIWIWVSSEIISVCN